MGSLPAVRAMSKVVGVRAANNDCLAPGSPTAKVNMLSIDASVNDIDIHATTSFGCVEVLVESAESELLPV